MTMRRVPITRLEATLLCGDHERAIVPPMPVRRRVTVEEFETDMRSTPAEPQEQKR